MVSNSATMLGPNGPTYLLIDWPMIVDFLFLFCIYVGWIVMFVYKWWGLEGFLGGNP